MKTWEMMKVFTESKYPERIKAYVLNEEIKNDKYYKYEFISLLDGVFYWNNDYDKGFRLNGFYNPLQIQWEIKE